MRTTFSWWRKIHIYRSRTTINQPLTGRDRRGEEDVWITDYGVWSETAKDEEWICREESVK
jgi:hypothetical protein